jgi:uncharacterized protein YpmS
VGPTAAICALVAASLACSFTAGGPTPPASPIPVSTEAAGELEDLWQDAIENAENGEVSVVMTEAQVTSYAALKLAEDPETPFSDIQVFLRDGKMTLHGNAEIRGVKAPAQIVLDVTTTAEGRLQVDIEEADFGPLPVPNSLLETLSKGLNELMTGEMGPQTTGVKITGVTIADGQMAVTGTVTR